MELHQGFHRTGGLSAAVCGSDVADETDGRRRGRHAQCLRRKSPADS